MSTFVEYATLSVESRQIRLLTILPSLFSSTIKCELSIVSLNDKPQYEALSYVWGDPANPKYIQLNKQKFSVTPNLHAALRALRRSRTKRKLWVDAVCINQSDISERNAQIAQMRFIYENAQQTAVWLGEDSAGSKKAIAFVKTFAAQARTCGDSRKKLQDWLADICILCSDEQERAWQELALLLSRPYWTRAWIYQEMVVSSHAMVHCGKDQVSWEDMTIMAFVIDEFENLLRGIEPIFNKPRVVNVYHHFYNAALAQSQRRSAGLMGAPTFLDALCTRRYAEAKDPKDKVYSLLGVVTNHFIGLPELPSGPDVQIDYSRSEAEVYKGVVRHIAKTTSSLDILCACQNPDRARGIPSWAPDWATKRTNNPVQNTDQWGHIHFACKNASIAWDLEPPDDDTLVVNGVYMDSITQIGFERTNDLEWEELKESWKILAETCVWSFEQAADIGPCYMNLDPIPQAFFETVTMGRIPKDTGHEPADLAMIQVAIVEATERRRFFVTEKGFMALGPAEVKVGDMVVVIQSVHVPIVLRKDETGDGHAVVGEAYVHGLMDGEAFDDDMRKGWEGILGRKPTGERYLLR